MNDQENKLTASQQHMLLIFFKSEASQLNSF